MGAIRLLLVRHGESVGNVEHRIQGQLDSPLTDRGKRQAEAIASRVALEGNIDALYSSPLRRALDTARAIGRRVGLEPSLVDDLMEINVGEITGMHWEEFASRWPEKASHVDAGSDGYRWPGGESQQELAERAARVMDKITRSHGSGTVVVVSHSGTLRFAVAHLMRGTEFGHQDHRFDNCTITEVVLDNGTSSIACANDSSHLAEIEEVIHSA